MTTHHKTASEALKAAVSSAFEPNQTGDFWENVAQTFLASEWGESDPSCSECGQRGTHRTEDCPFPKTPLLFADLANVK